MTGVCTPSTVEFSDRIHRLIARSGPDRRKAKSPRGCCRDIPTRLRPVEGYSAYHRLSHNATLVASTTCRPTYGRLDDTRLATVCRKIQNEYPTQEHGDLTYYRSPDTAPDNIRLNASMEARLPYLYQVRSAPDSTDAPDSRSGKGHPTDDLDYQRLIKSRDLSYLRGGTSYRTS